jgi:ribosome-binding protein aMBF1 (putative translation factor)
MTTAKGKDGLDYLIEKFVGDDPKSQAMMEENREKIDAAQLVYDLRTKAGLSQRELAKKVGTTASVICRMEQADYEGSLPMLRRITAAMDHRLELRAVPIHRKSSPKIPLRVAPIGRKKLASG